MAGSEEGERGIHSTANKPGGKPLPSCLTLGKGLSLSEPRFPRLKKGAIPHSDIIGKVMVHVTQLEQPDIQ